MQIIWTGLNGMGMIALITIAYGSIQPLNWPRWARHILLGTLFGAGACACMANPIQIGPGTIADLRNLFIGFAGVFLGPVAAGIAFIVASAMRVSIGGNGMFVGLSSMFLAMIIGVLWGLWRERQHGLKLPHLMVMGLTFSMTLLIGVIFLQEAALEALMRVIPFFVVFNFVGNVFFGSLLERERRNARRVRLLLEETFHDPLTSALNRRGLEGLYEKTLAAAHSRGMLLIDLDHFKKINDTHGHATGDETLRVVTGAIKAVIRSTDLLARVGGEEFIVFFPEISERDFLRISERIRMSIKENPEISYLNVTVSIGGTFWQGQDRSLLEAIERADTLMYAAKSEGRDRIVSDLSLAA